METNEVVEELATKIKVPKEIKENIYDKLFKNICIAIAVLLYFMFLNMGYMKENINIFKYDVQTFSCILVVSTITFFEIAYRKDDGEFALYGTELLVIGLITLFMPYVYLYRGTLSKLVYSIFPVYMAIYYLIKCVVIYIREEKLYKSSLSDIKEIIDSENSETYLDERNERKFKEDE